MESVVRLWKRLPREVAVTIQELSTCGLRWFCGRGGILLKVGPDYLGGFSNLCDSMIQPKLLLLIIFSITFYFPLCHAPPLSCSFLL